MPAAWERVLNGRRGGSDVGSTRLLTKGQYTLIIMELLQAKAGVDAADLHAGAMTDDLASYTLTSMLMRFGTRAVVRMRLTG